MTAVAAKAFEGTKLRLGEARQQREQLEFKWTEHLSSVPWEFSLESDSPFEHRLMGHERRPVPPQLGLHFGMWLQQQRAALDNALCACVGSRQGIFPPMRPNLLEFPIAESLTKFKKAKVMGSGAVDDPVSTVLEGYQPYRNHFMGNDQDPQLSPLYWLNDLARKDRHRLMHVGIGSIQISRNIFLYGGADHEVTHVVGSDHILTGSTCVIGFRTAAALRSSKIRFLQKPKILPDISDWISVKSNVRTLSLGSSDPAKQMEDVQMHMPLKYRMAVVEDLVLEICRALGALANLHPDYLRHFGSSLYPTAYSFLSKEEERELRRKNGG